MSFRPASALALIALTACATQTTEDAELFSTGSDAEYSLATDMAWDIVDMKSVELGLDRVEELAVKRVQIDDLGMAHTRFQQYAGGVPVFGGEAIIHLGHDGQLSAFTDALIRDIDVDTTPLFDAEEALDIAVSKSVGWAKLTDEPVTDLQILRQKGEDYLTWRVQLRSIDGSNDPSMPVLFIDAHTGDVVWSYDNLQTASGTGYYSGAVSINTYLSGSTYYLEDTNRHIGTYTYNNSTSSAYYCTDTDDVWNSTAEKVWVEAHYAAATTYDYYLNNMGRNGLDGAGGPGYVSSLTGSGSVISSFVNYGNRYANAFWDGSSMVYGDGDGTYFLPLVALDIAGHEMTHGVTEHESNLTYSGESGGLNEAMSDIFGASIEAYADGAVSSATWQIGEDAYIPSGALRYMNDPALDGYSDDYYTSSVGNHDVHYSSGVANLAYYLLSQGGTHPRGRSNTQVTGIGITEAAAIFYRANAVYLTSSSNFAAARTATLNAAADLYGTSSNEYTQVGNAWAAVGVGSSGGGSGTGTQTCATATGSLSRRGSSAYVSSSSGFSVTSSTTLTGALTGPSSADFDLYLQKRSGNSWSNVASGTTNSSTENVSYAGTSGTYRWRVYAYSGSGSYSLYYCR